MEFKQDKIIKAAADRLIAANHAHLKSASICYVMKLDESGQDKPLKPPRDGKHRKIASARKVPALYLELTGFDFIILVDQKVWDRLSLEQQEAVVDHELCHCRYDEKGWYVADHDVQEFRAILERHGFWQDSLREFVEAAQQQKLPFEPAAK